MNHHTLLNAASTILALALFVPMFRRIRSEGGAGQSCVTWLLWAALDLVLIGSLVEQRGNYWVIAGFMVGDLTLVALLVKQRQFQWGRFEATVLGMVGLCLVVWYASGARTATIAATAAACIAGLPGLVALAREPDRPTARIWLGYTAANALAFLGGTAMTLEQRLTPGTFTVYSLLMAIVGWRRRG
ncbi:MAG: hypothetical protein HY749_24470 [Gammaproteobacteria bacterium]|nr:hypothetical protein [Gammaproteobacteria bacterium]MBI5619127.1 hypothetical protein [Gammaproteobacteria bacterium]